MKENLSGTLAIDLGNTNTVVAFQDQKDINSVLVEIPNITSSPGVIPTAVWFEEPSKIPKIGISALKMRDNSNSDLFFHSNFKRLIGNSIEKINQTNILNPEIRIYDKPKTLTYEAAIKTNLIKDYYVTMSNIDRSDYYNIKFQKKPLMVWIWISVIMIVVGGSLRLFSNAKNN